MSNVGRSQLYDIITHSANLVEFSNVYIGNIFEVDIPTIEPNNIAV